MYPLRAVSHPACRSLLLRFAGEMSTASLLKRLCAVGKELMPALENEGLYALIIRDVWGLAITVLNQKLASVCALSWSRYEKT